MENEQQQQQGGGGGGPPKQQRYKKRKIPRQVRKAVPKKVRKATGKGYRKVKKNAIVKPVKKFQNTTLGQRIAPREKCSTCTICSYLFAILLLIASSIGLIIATGNAEGLKNFAQDLAPNLDIGNLEDPFAGGQVVGVWAVPSKSGLQMEILNALDDSWQATYAVAMSDWEYGSRGALSLTSTKVDFDWECTPVDGKIKVCNGDYGNKPWRGLATCVLDKDRNYANCACQMNDYYLKNAILGMRQYTMCHELGHGFGLPHRDEDFTNENLGTCLDYTEDFSGAQQKPDENDYLKLIEFYGQGNRRRRLRQGSSSTTTTSTLEVHPKDTHNSTKSSDQHKSTTTVSTAQPPIVTKTPPHIWQKRKTLLAQFEDLITKHGVDSSLLAKYGWKVVEHTLLDIEHQIDLGDGYILEVQISAPVPTRENP